MPPAAAPRPTGQRAAKRGTGEQSSPPPRGNLNFTVEVPAGRSQLVVTSSGGSGDADLYVKFGSAPTASSYDCRPYKSGNAETCTLNAPGGDRARAAEQGSAPSPASPLKASYRV